MLCDHPDYQGGYCAEMVCPNYYGKRTPRRDLERMTEGKRYRIIHQSPTQRYARESVMVYLGQVGTIMSFSAHPLAGTQEIPVSWIRRTEEVPATTPARLNARATVRFVVSGKEL